MAAHPNQLKALRMFQPGVSGNPSGRPKLSPELKAIYSLSHLEANKLISKYARMTVARLEESLRNPETPYVELAIARIFQKCVEDGDHTKLSFLLDRAIGKVTTVMEQDDEETDIREEIARLSMTELLTLVKTNLPVIENP